MLIKRTRLPKSTIGDEIRNEKVTPSGNPALVKPMNSGMEEQEQNGVYCYDRSLKVPVEELAKTFGHGKLTR